MEDNGLIENMDGLFEFINDAIFETVILHLYDKVKDPYHRQFVGNFLLTISDIYIYEFSKFKFIDTSTIKSENMKLLKDLRKNSMKYSFASNSDHFNKKATDMGLSYNNLNINDCVIYYDNNKKYVDSNFRMWSYYKENIESKKFFYDLIKNCDLWMKGLLKNNEFDFYTGIMEGLEALENVLVTELNKHNIKVVSYSVSRLFDRNKFEDMQKGFILNYYGFIKSILYFEKIFLNQNISITTGNVKFESKKFFCKLKSICIKNIYDYFKEDKSVLWNNFQKIIDSEIPSDFWRLSGLCRRNIHYKDFVKISDEDFEIIEKYQKIYFDKFIDMVDSNLNFKVTLLDKVLTFYAKRKSYDNIKK